nr:unnamed protein product [Spirometra erinaceieuropaei]
MAWHTGTTSINRSVALPAANQALRAQLIKQMSRRELRQNMNLDMSESMADTQSATPQPASNDGAVLTTAAPSTSLADEKTDSRCGVNKIIRLGRQLRSMKVASLAMSHRPRATITKAEQSDFNTLRADTSIVILPADKGRSTFVMDKLGYIQKVNAQLEDRQAYLPCNDEPMRRLVTQLDWTLADMQTSKATNLAVETVSELLESQYDETDVTVKRRHLVQLLRFCLKTYFTFKDTTYEQVKGTPMGSPLSGFIAEAVLQKVETVVFSTNKPKFWTRYVDDTFVIIKRQMVKEFHDVLNSVFPDIQFTIETEANNQLPFLEVLVHRKPNGHLKTTV